ncbi:glycosyl transferase [Herminiimonas sp. KBW02]|uniref:glycosyl transferase n=1 Tax=Herminiimonas sp. KBW02 TaxID=2153363 RepID=UPI000F58F82F|nr:glycosyl transferase [Herminiimonas sp. KBW02]RQO36104.1 glycosyl transferase [Herminiimonas sp. KBW02]
MHTFCTLFDSNYLTRGLALYQSLKNVGESFTLYAVCFDDLAYEVLCRLELPDLVAVSLGEFETEALLAVKKERTSGEYCWTCTPHVIRYVLDTYQLSDVTYLDADLYFYGKPSLLFDEFQQSNASVLITPHRYTPRYDQSIASGIYCVQFMTFKANEDGLKVLQWWQDRCLEWCFNRVEDGKFGDQKYLDDWPQRFRGVHVLQHIGGGVAPWNVQQYLVNWRPDELCVDNFPVIFYHYHGYKKYADGVHDLGGYKLGKEAVQYLYKPYVYGLNVAEEQIKNVFPDFDRGNVKRQISWKTPLRNLRRRLKGEFNEYSFV